MSSQGTTTISTEEYYELRSFYEKSRQDLIFFKNCYGNTASMFITREEAIIKASKMLEEETRRCEERMIKYEEKIKKIENLSVREFKKLYK